VADSGGEDVKKSVKEDEVSMKGTKRELICLTAGTTEAELTKEKVVRIVAQLYPMGGMHDIPVQRIEDKITS